MKTTAIIERSVLEDESSEVPVGSDDVVGLFFLSELVSIVLWLIISSLSNKRRCNQWSVHSTEQCSTEHTSNTDHMERMHKDIMFCLEYEHEVERTRYT